jgi:hypothetical protein
MSFTKDFVKASTTITEGDSFCWVSPNVLDKYNYVLMRVQRAVAFAETKGLKGY